MSAEPWGPVRAEWPCQYGVCAHVTSGTALDAQSHAEGAHGGLVWEWVHRADGSVLEGMWPEVAA